jgi:hypothetical protein
VRSVAALVLLSALGCDAIGLFEVNTYPTLSSAQSDRLFERGWLPAVLPPDSGPIVEAHDLDTNARCSTSVLPADGSEQVSLALLAAGFQPFSGELPPLPFPQCPFSLESLPSSQSVFMNPTSAASDSEFAVVVGGAFHFWSSR